jgi:NADP-dependent alcohol dehydrogenase
MVPFGTVLTLPATGEMNSGALWWLSNQLRKTCFWGSALFPKFSFDPTVIESLPQRQLKTGGWCLHVMEQYLTYPHEGYLQDRIAEGILQTLLEVGPWSWKTLKIMPWHLTLCGVVYIWTV